MISFDEILNCMKNAYFDECGENPDMQGDLGVRFKAVASELFDLGVYADYVMLQTSIETATGTYLDAIARECNLQRQAPSKASGRLYFLIDEPLDTDFVIPAGTICARKGQKFIQYITLDDGVIKAGRTYCIVNAKAMENGKAYNCLRHEIDTIVNPCAGVSGVRNDGDFTGGTDAESDFAFRQRILDHIKSTNNGMSQKSLENRIRNIDGVLGCCASVNGKIVTFSIKTATGALSSDLIEKINNEISWLGLFSVSTSIRPTTGVNVDAKIQYNKAENADALKEYLIDYIDGLNVGDSPNELEFESFLKGKIGGDNLGIKVSFNHQTIAKNNFAQSGTIGVVKYG